MGPEFGKASPIGIPVVLLLLIATVLLIRNMNKHIKNLPESFDAEHPEPDQLADEGTDRSGVERTRTPITPDLAGDPRRTRAVLGRSATQEVAHQDEVAELVVVGPAPRPSSARVGATAPPVTPAKRSM